MSSTGATADGFDRQFGIGRACPRDWQRRGVVPIHRSRPRLHRKFLRGRGRFAEQVQCLHLPDVRPAYRLDRPWACYESAPETVRFKYWAFLSYSHPDTRSTNMTGLQAELEAAFRKLPIAPADDGRIPYERLIPRIGRQLALMRPVERKVASPDATKRKLVALKKHAKILCEDMSAIALLPLKLRILIVEIAHAENPKLPPPAGRGAPQKSLAMQVARTVAEHFYGLTGTRPTRITPTGGGKAHGPFLEFLATTYTILGIKASAENQAKAAINFVMKKYPKD